MDPLAPKLSIFLKAKFIPSLEEIQLTILKPKQPHKTLIPRQLEITGSYQLSCFMQLFHQFETRVIEMQCVFCLECLGRIPRVFPPNSIPCLSCVPNRQAGFVQLQYTETTCCSSRADTHTLTVYKYRLLLLMWYPQCLIQTQYVISPVLIEAEVKLVFGQDLFCWFSPTRHLGDRVG